MLQIALKMLMGDKAKYFGIIIGLSFASFIISQQAAIFVGIMKRTYGFMTDTSQPHIWVMDPTVQYVDDVKSIKDTQLFRVRGVDGVEWAVPMFKGLIPARMRNGVYQTCILLGIDDGTLIGGPPRMLEGKVEDLRYPDAIIVDTVGANTKLAKMENGQFRPARVGDVLYLNDCRSVIVGICECTRTFQSQPIIYTTYNRAISFSPKQRDLLSFVIAKEKPEYTAKQICAEIKAKTGLAAYTSKEFENLTIWYYIKNTGIAVNFGVAIILGFIIGVAIAGQTFYNFTLDNIRFFGTFKAMGAPNRLLVRMIFLQALVVSMIGWGIGIGFAAFFGYLARFTELSFNLPPELYLLSGLCMFFICHAAAFLSMLKVVKVDPAIVFKS